MASWIAAIALDWNLRFDLNSCAISQINLETGSLRRNNSVDFWYRQISRRASVPDLNLRGFLIPLVAKHCRGAFPPAVMALSTSLHCPFLKGFAGIRDQDCLPPPLVFLGTFFGSFFVVFHLTISILKYSESLMDLYEWGLITGPGSNTSGSGVGGKGICST